MAFHIQAILLAAGRGTRMRSDRPKVLQEIFDRPLIDYPLKVLRRMGIRRPVVVVGWGKEKVLSRLDGRVEPVVQSPQRGTGHAVLVAKPRVSRFRGPLLIWPADMTLVGEETIRQLIRHHQETRPRATVLSALVVNPKGYGRIIRRGGRVVAIREELDATPQEKRIQEVNTGIYLFEPRPLFRALEKIEPNNRKMEYYLTDTIQLLEDEGGRIEAIPVASSDEAQGINSQADLSRAIRALNQRTLQKHQMQGVTIVAPEQTFVAPEVRIGRETVIYPWTYIERGVRIGRDCRIGPFAKICSGTVIEDGAVIGSFVEVVRSRIGRNVRAKHLAYLGDAQVGAGANIGAGTITANYDGRKKHRTKIGKRAFVGIDTLFVAPVEMGEGAKTGAGAVLTRGTRVRKNQIYVGIPARPLVKKGRRRRKRSEEGSK